jgi:hypothetical protein
LIPVVGMGRISKNGGLRGGSPSEFQEVSKR